MSAQIVAYLVAAVAFVVIDLVWLAVMAPRFYFPVMGDMVAARVNLPAAAVFYAIYPVGLVIFAVTPALAAGSVATAALYGALFGFFTYATYDLTNQATLRNWSWSLTLLDTGWGTTLAAIAAVLAFLAASRF